MIQSGLGENEDGDTEIPRLRKEEMKESELSDVEVLQYHGPKKPLMPAEKAKLVENTESLIGEGKASYEIALDKDLEFYKAICCIPDTPEFSGFNTYLARDSGQSQSIPTTRMYTPLIDLVPADPSTILTAVSEAIKLTEETGQKYTIITFDQQLYKILVDLIWVYPVQMRNVIPRLGGMHFLRSNKLFL